MTPKLPTYRQWEFYWNLHITGDFRSAAHDEHEKSAHCGALRNLDSMRDFHTILTLDDVIDAEMPPALNYYFVQIAAHFVTEHDSFPDLSNTLTEDEAERIAPVVDTILHVVENEYLQKILGSVIRTVFKVASPN